MPGSPVFCARRIGATPKARVAHARVTAHARTSKNQKSLVKPIGFFALRWPHWGPISPLMAGGFKKSKIVGKTNRIFRLAAAALGSHFAAKGTSLQKYPFPLNLSVGACPFQVFNRKVIVIHVKNISCAVVAATEKLFTPPYSWSRPSVSILSQLQLTLQLSSQRQPFDFVGKSRATIFLRRQKIVFAKTRSCVQYSPT